MHWIDWLIVCIPLLIVAVVGIKTQKYVKGVADFLTAGRVAGRYVICVASGEATMGLISLVAMYEVYYQSGFAYGFWGSIASPIYMVIGLTGYCVYRFRETRAMTMGQFLEIRYSRSFRIFAAALQSISGIINYGLFPAVGARFIVYFCDLPLEVLIGGWVFPTFALVMVIFLAVAVFVATMGGQITIIVTDCMQGILSYPLYTVIVIYIIYRFSWLNDLAPALLNRPVGKSLINPFDIKELRDFNLFYVFVGIIGSIINRMSWSGTQGYNTAAKNAHEQKMSGVLGSWRAGFATIMYVLLAVVAFAYLNSSKFNNGTTGSIECRNTLAQKAFDDVASEKKFDAIREEYKHYLATGKIAPSLQARLDKVKAEEEAAEAKKNAGKTETKEADQVAEKPVDKEPMLTVGLTALKSVSKKEAQIFGTIFGQMRVPMALKYILPIGLVGAFCALCIFLLISTDTTYLHSWGSILVQDLILPIRGKPFTPKQQITLLRVIIAGVAVFAFFFSYFFGQVDYIAMFFAITGAIWLGGAGACIVGGLYWKRGTTAGAFTALISGATLAVVGILGQKYWVGGIYPWIVENGLLETVTTIWEGISAPFEPWIKWRVTSNEFPINGQEIYAITMFTSIGLYIIVSLLTCRKPFNMDRMLHRGKYQREGKIIEHKIKGFRDALRKIIGINDEYSRGDKILTWSVFIMSFGWSFLFCFVTVAVWNIISPWPNEWWANWFFIQYYVIAGIIAVISTIWFSIGCTWDLRRLFKRLKEKDVNVLDDGRVIGNVSADDISLVEEVDHVVIEEAHAEEKILEEELEKEGDLEDLENLRDHEKKDPQD
jgi:solute:Na+ symporter, SSS family